MRRRVVVTGLGVVAPNGIGLADFEQALREGRSGVRTVPRLAELGFACTVAGVPEGVAEAAARVFARDGLATYLDRKGLPFEPFDDFYDIADALAGGAVVSPKRGRAL